MKKIVACLLLLCTMIALAGCRKPQEELTASPPERLPLDLRPALSDSVSEIVIWSVGEERRITDSKQVQEMVDAIGRAEFMQDESADMNAPGAVSVIVDVYSGSGTTRITFPYYLYEDTVYNAGAESIQMFDKYFVQ